MVFLARLDDLIFGNTPAQWLAALLTFLAVVVAATIAGRVGRRREKKSVPSLDLRGLPGRIVCRTRTLPASIVGLYLGARWLTLPATTTGFLKAAAIAALGVQTALYLMAIIDILVERSALQRHPAAASANSYSVLRVLGAVVVWVVVLLLVLSNVGVNVTGLVASLGVGGIAVALAAQNFLGDLFASLAIVFDRPFEVGDFITVGTDMGTVERIGLKTTRVRSLSGEQLVFANADLLSSRIRNFKRMSERRVVFGFRLEYNSSPSALKEVPALVRRLVEANENVRFDRAHFQKLGEFSLDFEVVYFVLTDEFNTFMDIQQRINLELLTEVRALGLEFAFPTRTLDDRRHDRLSPPPRLHTNEKPRRESSAPD